MPRKIRKPEVVVALFCVAVTVGHLGVREVLSRRVASIRVSNLETGSKVVGLPTEGHRTQEGCRLVVSFSPDCPACRNAAERESVSARSAAFTPRAWVTNRALPSLGALVSRLPARTEVTVDPSLYAALVVNAVPGLYLLDADDAVVWVGPYRGDESDEVLARRCVPPDETASPP